MNKFLLFFSTTTLLLLPFLVFGETSINPVQYYKPLIQMPVSATGAAGWQGYIDLLYATAISLAALLAVIKIVIAGAKYMFSDVVTNKGEAKKDIQGALFGLLLIMGAVVLLQLINPHLTNTSIDIKKVDATPAAKSANPGVTPAKPAVSAASGNTTNPTTVPSTSTSTTYPICSSINLAAGGNTLNTKTCSGTDLAAARKIFQGACIKAGGIYSVGYKGDPVAAVCIPKN